MVLRKKGQSDILMKSQTVGMHSDSLGRKGQYARTNCLNFFNKTYQNNLCSLTLQIGLFYLMNLNVYKQFGSSSKCQIGPFCAIPSIFYFDTMYVHKFFFSKIYVTTGKEKAERKKT